MLLGSVVGHTCDNSFLLVHKGNNKSQVFSIISTMYMYGHRIKYTKGVRQETKAACTTRPHLPNPALSAAMQSSSSAQTAWEVKMGVRTRLRMERGKNTYIFGTGRAVNGDLGGLKFLTVASAVEVELGKATDVRGYRDHSTQIVGRVGQREIEAGTGNLRLIGRAGVKRGRFGKRRRRTLSTPG